MTNTKRLESNRPLRATRAAAQSGTFRLELPTPDLSRGALPDPPRPPAAPLDITSAQKRLLDSSDLRSAALTLFALLDAEEDGRGADARFLLGALRREINAAAARRADPETVLGRAGKILAAIADAGPEGLTSTELARQFPRDSQTRRRLEAAGRIVRVVEQTATRPKTSWRLP